MELSFFIQRFSATDPTTCSAHGPAYNVSTTVNLALSSTVAEAALPPFVTSDDGGGAAGAASTSAASAQTVDDVSPHPAVLAVFQLQLDLSGRAGAAWMNSLSGAGPSSDVQVLGHDVGLLLALPAAAVSAANQSSCDAAAAAGMAASVSAALAPSGGAVRSTSCLIGPAYYSGLSADKVSGRVPLTDDGGCRQGYFMLCFCLSCIETNTISTAFACADPSLRHLIGP